MLYMDQEHRRIRQEEENECLSENMKHCEDVLEKMRKVYEIQGTPEKMETCKIVNFYRGANRILKMQHKINKYPTRYSAVCFALGIN